jgi:hypothetical protein
MRLYPASIQVHGRARTRLAACTQWMKHPFPEKPAFNLVFVPETVYPETIQ